MKMKMNIQCDIINIENGTIKNKVHLVFENKTLNSKAPIKVLNIAHTLYNQKDYTIHKILKSERNVFIKQYSHLIKTEYNHGHEFENYKNVSLFLKLNTIDSVRLKLINRSYIIQSLDFKKSILTGFAGVIIGHIGTIGFQYNQSAKSEPTIPPKQAIKKSIDNKNDKTSEKTLKIDSIIDKNKSE
jgi:hypothetical protein